MRFITACCAFAAFSACMTFALYAAANNLQIPAIVSGTLAIIFGLLTSALEDSNETR